MFQAFAQRLYLRIWLAVVGGVAVLTLLVGLAWKVAQEHEVRNSVQGTLARELTVTDANGAVVLQGSFERQRRRSGGNSGNGSNTDSLRFAIQGDDGQAYLLEMTPHRGRPPPPPSPLDISYWLRPPLGFVWLLGLVGLAVALAVFPIIRRLLKRLENLQRSVQQFGEGNLAVRVPTQGQDEVADLARQFNAAAERIQTLVQSHQSLLANASHELRSPLARIRMGLELMGDAPEQRSAQQEIRRNIAELDQLVDEILLASRLEQPDVDVGSSKNRVPSSSAMTICSRALGVSSRRGTKNRTDRFSNQRTQFTGPLPSAVTINWPTINGNALNSISANTQRSVRISLGAGPRLLRIFCTSTLPHTSRISSSDTVVRKPILIVVYGKNVASTPNSNSPHKGWRSTVTTPATPTINTMTLSGGNTQTISPNSRLNNTASGSAKGISEAPPAAH